MDTIQEIEERHNTVINIERSLNKLHQVFLAWLFWSSSSSLQEYQEQEMHLHCCNN
ncbi:hypothetical protein AAHE18_02G191800 [Arachis hypogaea]